MDRILNYAHNAKVRKPVVQSGMKKGYPKLFGGLSLVDWSMDGQKVLIKEKVGSTIRGIYKTYLYVYVLPDEVNSGFTLKLSGFDSAIRQYFREYQNKLIIKYRYDIVPLGFSAEDDDVIVAHCFVLDKEGKKLFMGTWGYNIRTNECV